MNKHFMTILRRCENGSVIDIRKIYNVTNVKVFDVVTFTLSRYTCMYNHVIFLHRTNKIVDVYFIVYIQSLFEINCGEVMYIYSATNT